MDSAKANLQLVWYFLLFFPFYISLGDIKDRFKYNSYRVIKICR